MPASDISTPITIGMPVAESSDQPKAEARIGAPIAKVSIGLVVSFFFALNFLFLLTSTGRVRTMDEVMPDFQSESLGARGSMAVPQAIAAHLFFGKIDRFGQPQAAYLPGQAVAALPWDLAGHHLSSTLTGVPRPSRDMFNDFFTVMSSATFSALACAFAFALFLSTGMATRTAFAAAGIFALATPLFAYSGWFYSEPLAAALLVGAALALFAGGATTSVSNSRAVVAGVLLGATVWIRAPHVLIAGAILLALVLSNRERKWPAALIAGTIISLAVVLLLRRDAQLWGNPFDFGYPAYAEAGKESLKFNLPFRGLYAFLLSPGKSIFLFAPPVFLAIFGIYQLWKRDRGLAWLAILGPAVTLFFYSSYSMFEGGYSYGPRYLVPGIALLCLALGAALEAATPFLKKLAIGLFAAGVLVNAIGLATSFLEAQVGFYYDRFYNYQIDYSPITRQTSLFFRYLTAPGPAPIGQGFDRWWIILSKAGISSGTLWTIGSIEIAGLAIATWFLFSALKKSRQHPA